MEELKEKLLSRIDFSILITITVALCSVWRFVESESIILGILVGTYFFMGLFLCFVKCREIFTPYEIYKTLAENTAHAFFNSWFYVLFLFFASYAIQTYLPSCMTIFNVLLLGLLIFLIYHKRKTLMKYIEGITYWYVLSAVTTLLLGMNVAVVCDKEYYDYNDIVYITFETKGVLHDEMEAIIIDKEGLEILDVTDIGGNTYAVPASELYSKDVYAVYTYPFKLNKDRVLKNPDLSKVSHKARVEKLSLKIRMPNEAPSL